MAAILAGIGSSLGIGGAAAGAAGAAEGAGAAGLAGAGEAAAGAGAGAAGAAGAGAGFGSQLLGGIEQAAGVTPGAGFGTMLGQFLGHEAFGGGGHPDGPQAAPPSQSPLTQLYPQTAAQPSQVATTPTAPTNTQAVNPNSFTPFQQGQSLGQQQLAQSQAGR